MATCVQSSWLASGPGTVPATGPRREARQGGGHTSGSSGAGLALLVPSLIPGVLPVWGAGGPAALRPCPGAGPLGAPPRTGGPREGRSQARSAGCPRGLWGEHCRKKCHCARRGPCHRAYGACLCGPGLYGRFCHLGESGGGAARLPAAAARDACPPPADEAAGARRAPLGCEVRQVPGPRASGGSPAQAGRVQASLRSSWGAGSPWLWGLLVAHESGPQWGCRPRGGSGGLRGAAGKVGGDGG